MGWQRPDVESALLVVLGTWSLLIGLPLLLEPWLEASLATLVSVCAATALALATRPRAPGRAVLAAGLASLSLCALALAGFGPATAAALLAPIFEEIVYRERLLLALQPALGSACAIALTSLFFALPHLEPGAALRAFLAGLALGVLMCAARSLALCIVVHLGLNAGAVLARALPLLGALVLAVAGAGLARPAQAAQMPWEGTLSLEFASPSLPPLGVTGTGVATVTAAGGGIHLASLRLAGGLSGRATLPVTDPLAPTLASVRATVTLGTGTLRPFSAPVPPSQPQLTQRTLPVRGAVRLCLLFPGCGQALVLGLTEGDGTAGLGVGGLLTAGDFSGLRISVQAAPWTVRSATLPVATSAGGTLPLLAQGWRHGPSTFTSSTATTGGSLSLVSPLRVSSDAGEEFASFARLSVRWLPEPAGGLLLASGVAGLLWARRRRSP